MNSGINIKSFLAVITCLVSLSLDAQYEQTYTQWNNAPLLINPAFNGYFNDKMRVSAIYRNLIDQSLDDQRFYQFNFELKPFQEMLPDPMDEWSFGVTANKHSALKNIYSATTLALTTAYSKSLDRDGYTSLTAGFQVAMHSQKVDLSQLDFTNQFDVNGYNTLLPNREPTQNYNNNYYDLNAGVLYTTGNETETFFAGLGASQLNYTQREIGIPAKFKPAMNLSLGYTRYINETYVFNISGNWNFNTPIDSKVVMAGFGTGLTDLSSDMLFGGLYYRFNEIVSPFVQFQKEGFKMTLSYDSFVSSQYTGLSNRKALELSAVFRFSSDDNYSNKAKLSCF